VQNIGYFSSDLTLYLTDSIFMMMQSDEFLRTKCNKFAIVVHFTYFVWDAKRSAGEQLAGRSLQLRHQRWLINNRIWDNIPFCNCSW